MVTRGIAAEFLWAHVISQITVHQSHIRSVNCEPRLQSLTQLSTKVIVDQINVNQGYSKSVCRNLYRQDQSVQNINT